MTKRFSQMEKTSLAKERGKCADVLSSFKKAVLRTGNVQQKYRGLVLSPAGNLVMENLIRSARSVRR